MEKNLEIHDWSFCKDAKEDLDKIKDADTLEVLGYIGLNNWDTEEFAHLLAHAVKAPKGIAKNWDKETLHTVLKLASNYIIPKKAKKAKKEMIWGKK